MTDQALTPPAVCPTCGIELPEFPHDQVTPSKQARALRRVAMWLIPVMTLAYLAQLFFTGSDLGFGTGAGYFAIAWICGPSLLLYLVSRLLPRVRLVICDRCSWNAEYPLPKTVGRVA